MLFLLSDFGTALSSFLGVFLGYSSINGVNRVSLRSMFSGAPLCNLICTRDVKYGVIVPYLINGTSKNVSPNKTLNWGET